MIGNEECPGNELIYFWCPRVRGFILMGQGAVLQRFRMNGLIPFKRIIEENIRNNASSFKTITMLQ